MPAVHFAIAAIPIAVYFLLIGGLRLRSRPLVTTGWRDLLTVGIAASGLVAIGPMQLFFPIRAAERLQGWVWIALFALYLLTLFMLLLSSKPRLLIYGLTEDQFRQSLLAAAHQVDAQAHWQDEILNLPQSGIQLASEPSGSSRVHQVVHVGFLRNFHDWLRLEREFVSRGAQQACPRSWVGWPLVCFGLLLLVSAIAPVLADPQEAMAQLQKFINR